MFKRYAHLYNSNAEFEAAYNGSDYDEPWLSVTDGDGNGRVNYNKTEREKLLGTQLTFKITSDGVIKFKKNTGSAPTVTLQYKKNDGEWTSFTSSTAETNINVVAGDKVMFRGDNAHYATTASTSYFNSFSGTTAGFTLEGNIMSLINSENFTNLTTLERASTLSRLFIVCTGLSDASKLVLPATTLARRCYSEMFKGCSSLTTSPELPATTLTENCYYGMFSGCTSLTTAPALPATTLAGWCYSEMFKGCTSLTTAPELPATTLAPFCYSDMFQGCTSLTTAPELPATTLADSCYYGMFTNCTNLTTAPALPATTLADYCYSEMFKGCTSLTTAPELPATTLANYCYFNMFVSCTSLTTAPVLPATTLANRCYYGMFTNCTNLTTAPELPATTLATGCYDTMFSGCASLNYIKAMFTTTPSTIYTSSWVSGVAASGTFVKNSAAAWDVAGVNGIPSDWTVETA